MSIDLEKEREKIKNIALDSGFKLKEQPNGDINLNPYVYEFAEKITLDKQEEINDLKQQIAELHSSRESLLEYKNKVEIEDYVLVPRKPTRKIVDAYWGYMGKDPYPQTMVFLWQEMIEASQ